MRLDDYRSSDNVSDQRGSGGGGFGGGGGGLGLLFSLVGSRFGIGGIIVVALGAMLFGFNPLSLVGGGAPVGQTPAVKSGVGAAQICAVDAASAFSCRVLASTEDTWTAILREQGRHYPAPKLDFYSRNGQSGCGAAQSAMGPFYCPTDQTIYLDTEFFAELKQKFQAGGDFAQAYVIAHEVGHHIQLLTGMADQVRAEQERASRAEGNALQVRMELQADCYAGVWAARNRDRLDPGDVEEGMRAAHQIGDDVLQRAAQGVVVESSFTHGSAAQRMAWLKRGIDSGDPARCDTFSGAV